MGILRAVCVSRGLNLSMAPDSAWEHIAGSGSQHWFRVLFPCVYRHWIGWNCCLDRKWSIKTDRAATSRA